MYHPENEIGVHQTPLTELKKIQKLIIGFGGIYRYCHHDYCKELIICMSKRQDNFKAEHLLKGFKIRFRVKLSNVKPLVFLPVILSLETSGKLLTVKNLTCELIHFRKTELFQLLKAFPNLQFLSLRNCRITDGFNVLHLVEALPKLTKLDLITAENISVPADFFSYLLGKKRFFKVLLIRPLRPVMVDHVLKYLNFWETSALNMEPGAEHFPVLLAIRLDKSLQRREVCKRSLLTGFHMLVNKINGKYTLNWMDAREGLHFIRRFPKCDASCLRVPRSSTRARQLNTMAIFDIPDVIDFIKGH